MISAVGIIAQIGNVPMGKEESVFMEIISPRISDKASNDAIKTAVINN